MVREYIPFAILVIISLSIRLDRASFRNFASVTIGAAAAWAVSPGNAISFILLALAVAISPLGPPLLRAALKILTAKTAGKPKSSRLVRVLSSNPDPINVLHDPPDAIVEYVSCTLLHLSPRLLVADRLFHSIVAVHGLGSSVETTWTHERSGKLWLRDFLSEDFPKARIMTFRHNSSWKSEALLKDLVDHGRQFLSALDGRRAIDKVVANKPYGEEVD